ncbi:CWF19-like protein 2 homolog [Cochliomyia hominivorax]
MNFIQFENARAKEKARQDLRDARELMLEEAKKRAEQRAEREASKMLKGESNWMLPSVEKKLKKKSKESKKSKRKKEKRKHKRSKKKSSKKRKQSSTEEECRDSSDSSSTSDESDSSSSGDDFKRRKKSKKSKKLHSKSKRSSSSEIDSDETNNKPNKVEVKKADEPLQRDSWMTDAIMLKTYSKERIENKPNEKQQIDAYDPAKSSRELNPYWKSTGTGLPAFKKPKDEDDYDSNKTQKSIYSYNSCSSKGWKKQSEQMKLPDTLPTYRKKSMSSSDDHGSSSDGEEEKEPKKEKNENCSLSTSEFLTDQQMNELGAKILKAEIMGNMSLANELRDKLEKARTQRNIFKERQKSAYLVGKQNSKKVEEDKEDEYILLTHTDQMGNTRPLPSSKYVDPRDLYGGRKKQKQKRIDTHNESGERIRYFADDDRHDLKQMFEREKYSSASDASLQFANIAAKHKNPNDDMDDIFAEKICKDNSLHSERKERDRAIREHMKIEAALDNCDKCFGSSKLQKELLVCVGENVYLALPWHQGFQPGHCMIIPNEHATCCTQIDENTWTEINDFRKAITRMFAAQRKDVIFFEIANKLHKRPHLVIHCIPICDSDAEMAPFYFKKAIEESEHEWCINKQLISLRNKSIRNSIPKGLPYFWVNFGMDTGFAHVIEDEERFPPNFAQEIIGGMLNLDANKWRRLQKEQNIITKVKMFADSWKKYDCTK